MTAMSDVRGSPRGLLGLCLLKNVFLNRTYFDFSTRMDGQVCRKRQSSLIGLFFIQIDYRFMHLYCS